MDLENARKAHAQRTMEFANKAIVSGVEGDHQAAQRAWQDALDYAEEHLAGHDICFWIRNGLGASLFENGDYDGALEKAGSALAYCVSMRAPLAAITMAKAYLAIGDVVQARDYAQRACDIADSRVFRVFSARDRETLGLSASA